MTKGELKTLILKLRSLTGLPEPSKITYFVDDEGLVNFKLWFNTLIIPKELLGVKDDEDEKEKKPTVWDQSDNVKDFRRGFSKLDFNEEYDDDYVIKQINTDEGFIVILPDDQNYKKVDKDSKENVNESVVFEGKNRLTEADEKIKIEGQQIEDQQGKDSVNGPESEHNLLIIPIPCAIDLSEEEVTEVINAVGNHLADLETVQKNTNPVDIKLIARPMAGFGQIDQYATMIKALVNKQPNAAASVILAPNDSTLNQCVSSHKGIVCCLQNNPDGFKLIKGFADPTKSIANVTDDTFKAPTGIAEVKAAQERAFLSSKKRMEAQMEAFIKGILPAADKFSKTVFDDYIGTSLEKSNTEDKDEKAKEELQGKKEGGAATANTTDAGNTTSAVNAKEGKTEESLMRRLYNRILEEEKPAGDPPPKDEESEDGKTEEKTEEKKEEKTEEKKEDETERTKAWDAAKKVRDDATDVVPFQMANLMSAYSVCQGGDKLEAYGAAEVAEKAAAASNNKQQVAKSGQKAADVSYKPGELANYGLGKLFGSHSEGKMAGGEGGAMMLFATKKDRVDGPKASAKKKDDSEAGKDKKSVFSSDAFQTFCCLKGVKEDMANIGLQDVPYEVTKANICTTHKSAK